MGALPSRLQEALEPVTIISGHYGSGKTNFSINLALDVKSSGVDVTLVDLDIVNPYFRASEQRSVLEDADIKLIAPVFSEAGTGLDVPSLTGAIAPALESASDRHVVIVDLGGDDVGAGSIGRFARTVSSHAYSMLYVLNRHRNLMVDPQEAVQNLREIELSTHLEVTGLVDNAHLKELTDETAIIDEEGYAKFVSEACDVPLVAKTVPEKLVLHARNLFVGNIGDALVYPIQIYIKNPWE